MISDIKKTSKVFECSKIFRFSTYSADTTIVTNYMNNLENLTIVSEFATSSLTSHRFSLFNQFFVSDIITQYIIYSVINNFIMNIKSYDKNAALYFFLTTSIVCSTIG